jgi:hypothetical protein
MGLNVKENKDDTISGLNRFKGEQMSWKKIAIQTDKTRVWLNGKEIEKVIQVDVFMDRKETNIKIYTGKIPDTKIILRQEPK